MTLSDLLPPTYRQMLTALSGWLAKAKDQSDDPDALAAARLAPDMFPLATQVRFACVQAYEGIYRLRHEPLPEVAEAVLNEGRSGGEKPGTLAEAIDRIEETLRTIEAEGGTAMDEGAGKPLELALPMGLTFDLDGDGYARDWALPQFYFHVSMAYAILRKEGIEIGKADFVPHMFAYLRPGTGPAR